MRLISGTAFKINSEEPAGAPSRFGTPSANKWMRDGELGYLLESTDYLSLKPALETLQRKQAKTGPITSITNLAYLEKSAQAALGWTRGPSLNLPMESLSRTRLASRALSEPGVVLDYRLVTTSLLNVNFGLGTRVGPAAAGKTSGDYWNPFATRWETHGTLDNAYWSDSTASGIQLVLDNTPGHWGNSSGDVMMDE